MRTYTVHGRAGYYPPTADVAVDARLNWGITRLPRVITAREVEAVSPNDACAQVAAWFRRQQTVAMPPELLATLGQMPSFLVFEPVAVTENVLTRDELNAIADKMEAEEAARKLAWAADKAARRA